MPRLLRRPEQGHRLRLRALAGSLALLALVSGACGGGSEGDRSPGRDASPAAGRDRPLGAAELRRAAARACKDRNETTLLDQDLPNTPGGLRRLGTRMLELELRLMRRLDALEGTGSEGELLRSAVRHRRRWAEAQLEGVADDAASRRSVRAFRRLGLRGCATTGAATMPYGPKWVEERVRICSGYLPSLRRDGAAVRASTGPERVRRIRHLAAQLERLGRIGLYLNRIPPEAGQLDDASLRELKRAAIGLRHLAEAIERGAAPSAVRAARAEMRRAAIRGTAAWRLLNIPVCDRIFDAPGRV